MAVKRNPTLPIIRSNEGIQIELVNLREAFENSFMTLNTNVDNLRTVNQRVAEGIVGPGGMVELFKEFIEMMKLNQIRQQETNTETARKEGTFTKNVKETGGKSFGKLAGIGAGLAAFGIGLGGFFAGLALGDFMISKLGTGENLAKMMINIAKGLEAFSGDSFLKFSALLGAGALFGAVTGVGKSVKAGIGMAAVGAGIGGFLAGIALGDSAMKFLGADGSLVKTMLINLAEGLEAFNGPHLVALGGMLGAGALFGATKGPVAAGAAAIGMSAIGAGIGGFIAGLGAGDAVMKWMGSDGSTMKNLLTNLGEGLKAFNGPHLTALAGMMAVGGLFGALPGGVAVAGGAAVGMTLIGAGIGGFLLGFAGVGKIANVIGIDGSGAKNIMLNLSDGLLTLSLLKVDNLAKLPGILFKLGPAIISLMTFGAGAEAIDAVISTVKSAWNWLTGGGEEGKGENKFSKIVEMLMPLEDLPIEKYQGVINLANSIDKLATSLEKLSNLDPKKIMGNISALTGVGNTVIPGNPLGDTSVVGAPLAALPNQQTGATTQTESLTTSTSDVIGPRPTKDETEFGFVERRANELLKSGQIKPNSDSGRSKIMAYKKAKQQAETEWTRYIRARVEPPKSSATRGAVIDKTSRGTASGSAPIVIAPSSSNVSAPTVNNSSRTSIVPPTPRRNSAPVGNMFVDPVVGGA
jgi:hypothetical protein